MNRIGPIEYFTDPDAKKLADEIMAAANIDPKQCVAIDVGEHVATLTVVDFPPAGPPLRDEDWNLIERTVVVAR